MKLDPKIYGGELAQRIEAHVRLAQEAADAEAALDAAERALSGARAEAKSEAIDARLKGDSPPVPNEEAESKLKAARWDAECAAAAALAAQDRVIAEAQAPAYDAKLGADEDKLTGAALKAADALESLLGRVSEVRAQRSWLTQPTRADRLVEPTVWPVEVVGEYRQPNGMPADAKALLTGVRSGLRRDPEQPAHEAYGLPLAPGEELYGPWGAAERTDRARMTATAAALFEEQARGETSSEQQS